MVRETTQQEHERAEVRLAIADSEVKRIKTEKEGESLADLMEKKNQAEAIRVMAEAKAAKITSEAQGEAAAINAKGDAEAHVMQAKGEAEAAAVMAKGRAEAEVLQKKADAFKHYGEAALVQLIVDKLPEIAQAMAAPLAKTDKMVFISTDGTTGSRVTADVGRMMAQLPEVVEGVTGVNINAAMQKLAGPAAGAFIASQMAK